ncbi:hypothetical protein [Streptomyces canus]|uniref:hypothetical protein n=1 Tax=Streptomyces canus TaxID=58343 RepID=UPI003718CDEF
MIPAPQMYGTLLLSDHSYLIAYEAIYDTDLMIDLLRAAWSDEYREYLNDPGLYPQYVPKLHGWMYSSRIKLQMYVSFLASHTGPIMQNLPNHQVFQVVTPMKSPGAERELLDWERECFYRGLARYVRDLEGRQCGNEVHFQYSPTFVKENFYQASSNGQWQAI